MDKMGRPLLAASARISEITVTAQKTSANTKAKSRATRWVPINYVMDVPPEYGKKQGATGLPCQLTMLLTAWVNMPGHFSEPWFIKNEML
jgi:hypothetical protein